MPKQRSCHESMTNENVIDQNETMEPTLSLYIDHEEQQTNV